GLVQILYNGKWGSVCSQNFDYTDASVICRHLGFSKPIAYGPGYGKGNGTIWLNNIRCNGYESSITACNHDDWGVHDCKHDEDIGITC
ncbi:uncharacterized protein TRIADDRAFT_17692, partial [Trichoplax adhaerens]